MAESTVDLPDDVPSSTNKLRALTGNADMPAGVLAEVLALQGEGGKIAEVNTRTDGKKALEVNDDCTSFEAQHVTLVAGTDTTITFAQPVRLVRVKNWDTANRILVKDGAITTNVDASASRVGFAPAASVPGKDMFPFVTSSIHLRSASTSEVTVEGYF